MQIIPHITNEIKDRIRSAADGNDIVITEIGGTVGDIESQPFLEAIRQFSLDIGREHCVFIHVTLIPYIAGSEELKSKPTQHSVKELLSLRIRPDVLVCRADREIPRDMREKISLFCNVRLQDIIQNLTADTLYGVPLMLEKEGLADVVCEHLSLENRQPSLEEWRALVERIRAADKEVRIAIVGKYVELHDAYLSVVESLNHAGYAHGAKVQILWTNSEKLTDANAAEYLADADGVLVPGGFGNRGIEGKIAAIRYARENNVPFFGICLGMQMAAVEFARHALNLPDADSEEFRPDCANPVIHIMETQKGVTEKGGTMRLGLYPCELAEGSLARTCYDAAHVDERHRHRYEFNNAYREAFAAHGMRLSGISPDGTLVEIIELTGHPWFVGVQFHPEFKSRPNRPHPLFRSFIGAALRRGEDK